MTVDFTSLAFVPLIFFHQDQDCLETFTSKKWGWKCPPQVKLLACGFAFTWRLGFYSIARESIFYVVSQEANEHIFMLYCCIARREQAMATICMWYCKDVSTNHCNVCKLSIARSNDNDKHVFHVVSQWGSNDNYIFYIISQGSKRCYSNANITRTKELQQSNFYCCWLQKTTMMSISLCCIAREATAMIFFVVARSGCIASVHATTISQSSRDTRMQQSNNTYAVGCKDDSNKRCWLQWWQLRAYPFMLYCKEQQRQTMVDCNEGACAKQQPTKLYVASQQRATTAE